MNPFWLYNIFSKGLVQPSTRKGCLDLWCTFSCWNSFPVPSSYTGLHLVTVSDEGLQGSPPKRKHVMLPSYAGLMAEFCWQLGCFTKNSWRIMSETVPSGKLTWLAGKWSRIEDVFPIENGDFSIANVSLLKGISTSKRWRISILKSWSFGASP